MYSRSYFQNDSDISIPENYDGTAFSDESLDDEMRMPKIEPVKNEIKFSPKNDEKQCCSAPTGDECETCMASERSSRGGLFGIDFKGMFGSMFSSSRLSSFIPNDFGIEEIIIIGIALFLLFSPEHDIECALLILALIFIK